MMRITSSKNVFIVGFAIFIAIAAFGSSVSAQTSGKIAGMITDASDGQGMPGVNVVVVGTNLGSSTDSQGRYFILNVPPGSYTLRVTFIGYKAITSERVMVSVGLTTEANFALESTVIEGEEIVVTSVRPLVEKSQTVSASRYSTSELNNSLPVANVKEIFESSPSVYRGYIRGGNRYETKTLVDGVDVSDSYFSSGQGSFGGEVGHTYMSNRPSDDRDNAGLTQSAASLQEVQVFAGTFNAEYPAATAGIINVVTKEGGRNYTFNLFNRTLMTDGKKHPGSNIYHDSDEMLAEVQADRNAGTPTSMREANLMTWNEQAVLDDYNYDPVAGEGTGRSYETSLTFSGPLTNKGGFFFEGRFSNDVGPFPFERQKNIGGSLKLHYNLDPTKKLTGMFQLSDGGQLFNFVNWKFNPRYKFFMNGAPRYKDLNTVGYLKFTHAVNARTFYEIQASHTNILTELGYPDDDGDGFPEISDSGDFIDFDTIDEYIKYVGGNGEPDSENGFEFGDTTFTRPVFFSATLNPSGWQKLNQMEYAVNGVLTNGQYLRAYPIAHYQKFSRKKFNVKADVTSQINFNHQIKAGVSYTRHNIDVNSLQAELGGRGREYPTSKFHVNQWEFQPQEFSAYLQDKIEFEGLIVNVGARVDGFDNDTELFANEWDPIDVIKDDAGDFLRNEPKRGEAVGFQFYFSPRVGVSHPVTDNLAMHYAFGRFFQYPNYATIYTDYNFTDYAASPNSPAVRPDQDPVRSTNYEFGAQWALTNDLLINATAYYRDVENTRRASYTLTTAENVGLIFNSTVGYSDARGIEIELSKRAGKWWGGRISYAYTYIKESIGGGGSFRSSYSTSQDSSEFARLPWELLDLLPTRERNVLVTSGGTNTLAGGYDRPHRVNATMQLFLPADINATFIGEWTSGFYYQKFENESDDPFFNRNLNLEVGPSTFYINARLSKYFRFGSKGLEIFVEGRNIFDRTNIRGIANSYFDPAAERKIWEQGRSDAKSGQTLTEPLEDPEGALFQPTDIFGRSYYLNAREFYFGINFNLNN